MAQFDNVSSLIDSFLQFLKLVMCFNDILDRMNLPAEIQNAADYTMALQQLRGFGARFSALVPINPLGLSRHVILIYVFLK
jgi:hypothetical protein